MKPADYRKSYQEQVGKAIRVKKVAAGKVVTRIKQLRILAKDNSEYKVSMTPLTLKNIGIF